MIANSVGEVRHWGFGASAYQLGKVWDYRVRTVICTKYNKYTRLLGRGLETHLSILALHVKKCGAQLARLYCTLTRESTRNLTLVDESFSGCSPVTGTDYFGELGA